MSLPLVRNAMFLFEVVVEKVQGVEVADTRGFVIKTDFSNIFSLELKDPKQMHIVMPEPLPLPPVPVGKKGKKKKKPKPKKKGKKGKGKVPPPPPEPVIQSGQSVLFSSSAEILIQNMKNCPMELSLWSKEDTLVFVGTTMIPWDPIFLTYLTDISNCKEPPPVTLRDEYNIFEENKAKVLAKIAIQVKLSFLSDKLTTSFRTMSEDPTIRKFLYTGINSKTTSYMCTLKSTDKDFEENCKKIENQFIVDKPKPTKIAYADYKNAPGANLAFFNEKDYCCMGHADKPPESIYKSPETCPDINFIIDYVRKIIVSCNDNLRMLTPRPTITPRIKATDIDRLCYCRETRWPKGDFADRFKKEAVQTPCPICIDAGKPPKGQTQKGATFDIANIRGPCGKPECKIARDIRAYIENLVEEDAKEFTIDDLIGPCGSKDCTLAATIQDFLRHEGVFSHGATREGLATQCACIEKMKASLTKRESCESVCSKDCEDASSSGASICDGLGCPYQKPQTKVYDVFYFTVEYNFENKSDKSRSASPSSKTSGVSKSDTKSKVCHPECPSGQDPNPMPCSPAACHFDVDNANEPRTCVDLVCPTRLDLSPSPRDSNVEIGLDEIQNLCCVKSCDTAEKVRNFIIDGASRKKVVKDSEYDDPCFCDCVCTFKFSKKTTYCAVCGGYECLGDDMRYQPEHIKPHPCPVYHKLYDKDQIKVRSAWPELDQKDDGSSARSSRTSKPGSKSGKSITDKKSKDQGPEKKAPEDKRKKSIEKIEINKPQEGTEEVKDNKGEGDKRKRKKSKKEKPSVVAKVPAKKEDLRKKYHYPPVPGNMGWNWVAEDIPGMKVRPNWKPGAANAILVRRYRAQRGEGEDSLKKKKRAMMQRKKKIEMKPTLVVSKRDGEFTVQMEVFKKFSKERLLFQYPYDEKPPLMYTVGKTAEEVRKIQRQRDRRERRETRRKSRLLQSSFRDRCQEICLKAYNQAIGVLPLPNPNSPDCPCTDIPINCSPPTVDSCSCSDDASTIETSDTDNDEWVIEFTPPSARWKAKAKHPPVMVDSETQYTYLDYKVKVVDKSGNQVPRFFKGPDGKQECSDLGGFWGIVDKSRVWLEINKDGYIGPDERWVPQNFTGHDGMLYSSDEGVFTDANGKLWKIGIDGYVDKDGKWAFYCKKKVPGSGSKYTKSTPTGSTVDGKKGVRVTQNLIPTKVKGVDYKTKRDAAPEKRETPAKDNIKNKSPIPKTPPILKLTKNAEEKTHNTDKTKAPVVMAISTTFERKNRPRISRVDNKPFMDRKALAKYREIIEELRAYDDIGELKPPPKANRASNTPMSQLSNFTMRAYMSKKMPSFTTDRSYGFGTSNTLSSADSQLLAKLNIDDDNCLTQS